MTMRRFLILFSLFPALALAQETAAVTAAPDAPVIPAQASLVPNDPYTISDVVVDVTADNAVDARAEAFEKGAALAVAKFVELQGADIDTDKVDPDTLVRDFQVNEEHFSRTRYTGVLTYRFKPTAMAHLVNAVVPADQALPPVDETAPVPPPNDQTAAPAPIDYDAPWNPGMAAGQKSAPPSVPTPASGALSTWPLSVHFTEVAQWLKFQNLLNARPELRGLKLISMGGDNAQLELTTEGGPAEVQKRWQAIGWSAQPAGGGLTLDAAQTGQ